MLFIQDLLYTVWENGDKYSLAYFFYSGIESLKVEWSLWQVSRTNFSIPEVIRLSDLSIMTIESFDLDLSLPSKF